MRTITLQTPLDMHIHFRDNEMLNLVAPLTAKTFSGAVIMPNLVPPVTTKEAVVSYKQRILKAIGDEKFEPFMTL
ncbi:MAG: dihydroorotase, partial [Campylobacteraceae bacterium]|nr:dihydroorotase [Campylobacteraceae bacterium]